jgi:hypothetical protein
MRYFKLHNKERGVDFKMAPFGVWNTSNPTEAKEMLLACREYLRAIGLDNVCEQVVLQDLDTGEELSENAL